MKIAHAEEVVSVPVEMDDAVDVRIRVLIGPRDKAPNVYMRQFSVAAGGHTPYHQHDWEHEVFVLEGKGKVVTAEGEKDLQAGDCVLVAGGEKHAFVNSGADELTFLCMVPTCAMPCPDQ